ncbi:hypothetical protein TNCV_1675781 [Trichonephila clavipes]|nr:hypothetical protein TNCV_1675781 [Trichonephila clavipes]
MHAKSVKTQISRLCTEWKIKEWGINALTESSHLSLDHSSHLRGSLIIIFLKLFLKFLLTDYEQLQHRTIYKEKRKQNTTRNAESELINPMYLKPPSNARREMSWVKQDSVEAAWNP